MRTERKVKKMIGILDSKSTIFVIVLVLSLFQTAQALVWERVVGGESPGVRILDEDPLCWFSPSHYSVESPSTITLSNIQYDSFNRVIEYDAEGTGNGYPIETHVYDGTYNSLGKVVEFRENRYYPTSGNAYNIRISGVTYDASGHVENGYGVTVSSAAPPPKPPKKATNPSPINGATEQPLNLALSWSNGGGATSFRVYIGIDPYPDDSEFMGEQKETTFDPNILLYGTDYYWRIDAKNSDGTTRGSVWKFTTTYAAFTKTIYVDDDAIGANDGSSWEDGYNNLQDALSNAYASSKPVEIRVAKGTYKPDKGIGINIRNISVSFRLIRGVTLKGGYAGFGASNPDIRNRVIFETILSGDLLDNDGPNEASYNDNSNHVVDGSDTDESCMLDGITITAGHADSSGGGMYNNSGNPTISNCTFRGNFAPIEGGAIYNDHSNPILNYCTFSGNTSKNDGGAIYNHVSSPILTDCTFIGNSARSGGAIESYCSRPILTDCTFIGNSAEYGGGGISAYYGGHITLINCTFIGNSGTDGVGGGMCISDDCDSTLTNCTFNKNSGRKGAGIYSKWEGDHNLTNCTFSGNSANSSGGAMYFGTDSRPILTNCIVWGNTHLNNSQIDNYNESSAIITYSNIQGGWEGEGNIDVDPLFADPNNGDYHLKSQMGRWDPNSQSWIMDDVTSPCIDAGDPNSDWSSETWPHGERINMGAYGGTRQASMSLETEGMTLPRVAYIFSRKSEVAESFESLLEVYGCPTTLIKLADVTVTPLDSYDLVIVANNAENPDTWSDPNTVAAIEDSGKPVVGLGEGGYTFFGLLELAIGYPNGGHGIRNTIEVIDPNSSLFSMPYSIEIPQDRALQLYTETNHVGLYLWPTIPETVTALGGEVNNVTYYPLAIEHNRYLLWGFTESPQKMTEIGKTLFINVVIWTANKAWESEN